MDIQKLAAGLKKNIFTLFPFLCVAFAMLPVVISVAAGFIALMLGCSLNEAGTDPCVRLGLPFGYWLYPFGMAGWFSMFTIPVGGAFLVAWGVWALIRYFRKPCQK